MCVTTEDEYFVLVLCVRFGFTSTRGKSDLSVVKLTEAYDRRNLSAVATSRSAFPAHVL